jgi:hypothetical protein
MTKYKAGDKVVYSDKDSKGVDWFVDGSILTFIENHNDSNDTGRFSGPAKSYRVGGRACEEGDTINGFAMYHNVIPYVASLAVFSEEVVNAYKTTITIPRKLTEEEVDAIHRIVGVK